MSIKSKPSVVLNNVLRVFKQEEYRYVCHAIIHYKNNSSDIAVRDTCELLLEWIEQSLQGELTVIDWLTEHHPRTDFTETSIYRIAWIENMIEYWESNGL